MKKVLLIIILTLILGSNAHAVLLFSDDFENVAKPEWGEEVGNWNTYNGTYLTDPPAKGLSYSSVTSFPDLTDFVVEFSMNNIRDGGVYLRSSVHPETYPEVTSSGVMLIAGGGRFPGSDNNHLYWHILDSSDPFGMLNEGKFPNLVGNNFNIRVEVVGNTYSAFVDGGLGGAWQPPGIPLTTLVTDKYPSGSVALYSNVFMQFPYESQTFDNFALYDFSQPEQSIIPEPSTILLLGGGLVGAFVRRRRSS